MKSTTAGLAVFVGFLALAAIVNGFPGPDVDVVQPWALRDAQVDWASTREAWTGTDTAKMVDQMAADAGRPDLGPHPYTDPELPGAYLLGGILALAPPSHILAWAAVLSAFALAASVRLSTEHMAPLAVVVLLLVVVPQVKWLNSSIWVAPLVIGGWRFRSGVLWGLAAVLRPWALALVLIPLFRRRPREALTMAGTWATVNACGLLLPGVSIDSTMSVFDSVGTHSLKLSNGSLGALAAAMVGDWGMLAGTAIGLVAVLVVAWRRSAMAVDQHIAGVIAVALVTSPIFWPIPYSLALLPVFLSFPALGAVAASVAALTLFGLPGVVAGPIIAGAVLWGTRDAEKPRPWRGVGASLWRRRAVPDAPRA